MGRSPKVITAVLFVSVFLGALDTGVVVPTLTAIIQEWSVPYQWGIWTITLYLLMFVMSMPFIGNLAKRFGRQYILCVSLALFGTGAACSGFAPNFTWLLIGRFLQGIGGGGLVTLALAILARHGASRQFGLIGIPFGAGAILAFLSGSLFVTALHWRWIFFVQMALAFLAACFIFRNPTSPVAVRKPLDVIGTVLFTCIVLCLMIGFTSVMPEQFWETFLSSAVFPFIVVALGLTVPFVMVERQYDMPFMPLRLFRQSRTVLVFMIGLFSGISWISLLFIPAFSENLLRLDPGVGGYMLAVVAVMAVLSIVTVTFTGEWFGAKLTVTIGYLSTACGFLLLATVVHQLWTLMLAISILGLGIGVTAGVSLKPFLSRGSTQNTVGSPLPVVYYFRVIGVTVGAAVLVTFLTQATHKIPERVKDSLVVTSPGTREVSSGIFSDLVAGSSQFIVPNAENLKAFIPSHIATSTQELILRQIMRVIRGTLAEGYQNLFLASTVFALLGFVCAMVLFRLKPPDSEEK